MKKKKDENSIELRKQEIFAALSLMESDKGISMDYMISQIKKAIVIACKNVYKDNDDITVNIDPKENIFEVYLNKVIVDEVTNINKEISLANALKVSPRARIGEKVSIKLDTMKFARTDVQKVKGVLRQSITDSEKSQAIEEYQKHLHENITVTVEQVDPKSGNAAVKFEKGHAKLFKSDQIPNEIINAGDKLKIYVSEIKTDEKGTKIILSRTHPEFVKRLFEAEVPEISDGTVLVKSISREAGSRTKIAVYSKDENIDAVGACIGQRGQRVGTIVSELNGEKIDIVEYNDDPVKFISAALSPANVVNVEIDPNREKSCKATVPDDQLSLAIGNKGQNVRLAAKLTGWKIDIRAKSVAYENEEDEENNEGKNKYVGDGLDDDEIKNKETEEKIESNSDFEESEELFSENEEKDVILSDSNDDENIITE